MTQDPFTRHDAAYVLGALSSEDRQAFEEHLVGCERCSRAVRDLAGLPGLLSRVDVRDIDSVPPPPVPESLLPDLLASVRRDRRRRSVLTIGVAAASTALVVGGAAVVTDVVGGSDGGSPTPAASAPAGADLALQQMTAADGSALAGWVGLEPVPWGTRLTIRCRYTSAGGYPGPAGGAQGGPTYHLVVRGPHGGERVASWAAVPGEDLTVVGATALQPAQIERVEVQDDDGHAVLSLAR